MPDPIIRRARPEDAQALAAIGARTFSDTFAHLYPPEDLETFLAEAYGLDQTRRNLTDTAKAAWLVEADGQVVGYAEAGPCALPHPEVTAACGELKRFYLLKDWQNGGLGRRLFTEVIGWLQAEGPRDVWIGVWSENYGAQRFYGREGFEKVGEYGFEVGKTIDREFILRKRGVDFATPAGAGEARAHDLA
ncbi:N-acetyltransferase family protein [Phenylobacterium sp.]|uniref:GNAT family N-acetyltransferase n=1 Tax=Phenylobacterium sp. TaxID=1871053 RepID=UPI0035B43C90